MRKQTQRKRKGVSFLFVSTHLEDFKVILVGNCESYACKIYHCITPKSSEYDHIGIERRFPFCLNNIKLLLYPIV